MASITFIISGGVPDYTVEIVEYGISELFPAEGDYVISGDFSGCFTLRITDANGCIAEAYDCCPTITWDAEFISHTCEQTWECDLDYNILEISFLTTTTTSTTSTSSTTTTVEPTTSTTTSTSTSTTTTTSTTSEPTTTTTTTVEPTTTTTTTCDPSKCDYGLLYNWYAVNTGKLAPTGWHVPTDEEWTTLITYLGGEEVAGEKLKSLCDWIAPNEGATNESGFSGLPGGNRYYGGDFYDIGGSGLWWSSTEASSDGAWYRLLLYYDAYVYQGSYGKGLGFSVRCLRDTYEGWENDVPVVDYDGNEYDVVEIGTQLWLVQNLKVTHYNDGEAIPNVEDNSAWAALTTGALCAYDNDWETYACVSEPTTTTTTTTP